MISVLIVDDHPMVREGLRAVLATTDDIAFAGEAVDGAEAAAMAARTGTDSRGELRFADQVARSAGHLVVPLAGVGGGGIVVADRKSLGRAHPIVLASTWSRNAFISANVRLPRPVHDAADLAANRPDLVALLDEVIDDLRS